MGRTCLGILHPNNLRLYLAYYGSLRQLEYRDSALKVSIWHGCWRLSISDRERELRGSSETGISERIGESDTVIRK